MHATRVALLNLATMAVLAGCAAPPASSPVGTTGPSPTVEPPMTDPPMTTEPTSAASPAATATAAPGDPLLAVELTDVRSGETFTLAELAAEDGPVLLEPMAIWCSNCRAQQHEVVEAHAAGDFTSVSLDVDPTELPNDLAAYADREGFDWAFVMADADLHRLLRDRFGVAATNPPLTPLIVIEPDGTVRPLEFGVGVRSEEQLLAEIAG